MVDLHVHSTKSDGTLTPTQLVAYAIQKGLSAFALTDHDTIDGLKEAIDASRKTPVTVIPGIEFSTVYENKDVHVVGLFLDFTKESFREKLRDFIASRELRNEKMCQKLREIGHVDITYDALKAAFPHAAITRAHYGKYLMEHGYVGSINEAFDRFLGDHAPCFVPRENVTPVDAIHMIHSCGGLSILAHPPLYRLSDQRLDQLVKTLTENGLDGIEAYYSTYTKGESDHMISLAYQYHLAVSGGSDFHGTNKPSIDLGTGKGSLNIPEQVLDNLIKQREKKYNARNN